MPQMRRGSKGRGISWGEAGILTCPLSTFNLPNKFPFFATTENVAFERPKEARNLSHTAKTNSLTCLRQELN